MLNREQLSAKVLKLMSNRLDACRKKIGRLAEENRKTGGRWSVELEATENHLD
jgi:hypothetical protein